MVPTTTSAAAHAYSPVRVIWPYTSTSSVEMPQVCSRSRSSGDVIGRRRFACVASRNKVATVGDRDSEDEEKQDAEDERKGKGEGVVEGYSPPVRSLWVILTRRLMKWTSSEATLQKQADTS